MEIDILIGQAGRLFARFLRATLDLGDSLQSSRSYGYMKLFGLTLVKGVGDGEAEWAVKPREEELQSAA